MSNPLDPIMKWYEVNLDCLAITIRGLERGIRDAVRPKNVLFGQPIPEAIERIEAAKVEVADLVVLSPVSTFERTVRDHLASSPRVSGPIRDDVDDRTRRQILADMEFWRLSDEILGIFSGRVNRDVAGQVKQTIDYRNWIAHGRSTERPPRSNVVPLFAYRVLTQFLTEAGMI